MQFYRIKQLTELTGKSERTLQRLLQKIRKERPNYYNANTRKSPTEPKAKEVNEKLLADYKLKKQDTQPSEQENNRKQGTDNNFLTVLYEQLKVKDQQIEEMNQRLREVQVNLNMLMQKIPQLEAPKNSEPNATSDDLSEEVVIDGEQSKEQRKEAVKGDFSKEKKKTKKSRPTSRPKQNKGLKTQTTRAKKGKNRKKTPKKPSFWKEVGKWLNS